MKDQICHSSPIPISLLWSCIKGQIHKTGNGINSFEETKMSKDVRENMACELWMKKSILHDILNQIITLQCCTDVNMSKYRDMSSMIDEQGIRIVFQDTINLIARTQPFIELGLELQRYNEVGDVSLFSLFQLVKSFISESLDFLQVSVVFIVTDIPMNLEWLSNNSEYSIRSICDTLIQETFHLGDLFLSGKILDFVSLLSACGNLSIEGLSAAHWNQLVHNKPDNGNVYVASLPHSIAMFVSKELELCCLNSGKTSSKSALLIDLLTTIVTPSGSTNGDIFRYHFCAHWAHRMTDKSSLYQEYNLLLESLHLMVERLAADVIKGTESKRSKSNDLSTKNVPMESISVRCIPMTYEILLTMCAASFALNTIAEDDMDGHTSISNNLVKCFGATVELYTSNFKLFPAKTLDVTIKQYSVMIEAFEVQLETCSHWGQRVSDCSPRKAWTHEALNILQPIFDSVKIFSSAALDFCDIIDVIADDEVNDASQKKRKPINILETQCERLLASLQEINGSHNYFLPSSLEMISMEDVVCTPNSKSNRANDSNQDRFGAGILSKISTKKTKSTNSTIEGLNARKTSDNDDDSFDSFGAVGDWGNDDDS